MKKIILIMALMIILSSFCYGRYIVNEFDNCETVNSTEINRTLSFAGVGDPYDALDLTTSTTKVQGSKSVTYKIDISQDVGARYSLIYMNYSSVDFSEGTHLSFWVYFNDSNCVDPTDSDAMKVYIYDRDWHDNWYDLSGAGLQNSGWTQINLSLEGDCWVCDSNIDWSDIIYLKILQYNFNIKDYTTNYDYFYIYDTNLGILNLSFFDEETETILSGPNITIQSISDNYEATNYTITGSMILEELPIGDYILYYDADGFGPREHHVTVELNQTKNVNLYLLNSSHSNNKIIRVIDEDSQPIESASVRILRQTASDFIIVNEVITNFEGETTSDFVEDVVYYKFMIYVDDALVKETEKTFIISTKTELTIQVAITEDELASLKDTIPATTSLTLKNVSGVLRYTYTWAGGEIKEAKLDIVQRALKSNDYVLAENTSTGAFGTLTLDFTPTAGILYVGEGFVQANSSDEFTPTKRLEYQNNSSFKLFGLLGLLASFIIIGGLASLFSANPSGAIVMAIIGLIVVSFVGFFSIGYGYVMLLVAVAAIIVFNNRT